MAGITENTGIKNNIDISLPDSEAFALVRQIRSLSTSLTDMELRKILLKNSTPYRKAAQAAAPRSEKIHHRYKTSKLIARRRAPKGFGTKVATYYPGNLAGSIGTITTRRKSIVVVGPKRSRRGKSEGSFGPGQGKYDGWYASTLKDSSWRETAWGATRETVYRGIINDLTGLINKNAKNIAA